MQVSASSAADQSKFTSKAAALVVFVVGDDISVQESLELLIRTEGWRAETFASKQDFLFAQPFDGWLL